jgi:hypothetical protein
MRSVSTTPLASVTTGIPWQEPHGKSEIDNPAVFPQLDTSAATE